MPDVNGAVGKAGSTISPEIGRGVRRVTTPEELEKFLPTIAHHELATLYAVKHFQDPDTVILYRGQSCIMASIMEHDFFGRIALIVWGQNSDKRVDTVH